MPCTVLPGGVIACSRRKNRCSVPGCRGACVALCDFALASGRTCDRAMCLVHRTRVGPNRDYCPAHAPAGDR